MLSNLEMNSFSFYLKFLFFLLVVDVIQCSDKDSIATKKKSWKDKDIADMKDNDLEHLLEQWELNSTDKNNIMGIAKKGKGTMMLISVRPEISVTQADIAMRIWHTNLHNNHIVVDRYAIEDRRSIFVFPDGSKVTEAKEFLVQQPELAHLTFGGQVYDGQYTIEGGDCI